MPNSLIGVISEVTFEKNPIIVVIVANSRAEPTEIMEVLLALSISPCSTTSSLNRIVRCIP